MLIVVVAVAVAIVELELADVVGAADDDDCSSFNEMI